MAKLTDKLGSDAVVGKTCSTQIGGDGGPEIQTRINFSFEGLTIKDALEIALKDAVIQRQRVYRKLSPEKVREMDGETVHITQAGKQPQDPKKLIAALKAQGYTEKDIREFFKDEKSEEEGK